MLSVAQAAAVGGPAGMLQVGEQSALRPLIESELGAVPLVAGGGHDGQIYYAIGLDLLGQEVAPLLDHGSYRYRRIAYPLIASLGGLLDGPALLYGMLVLAVISIGTAAGGVAAIATRLGRSEWLALAVVLNPGMWLSVRLLTSDALAVAAMVLGLWGIVSGWTRRWAPFTLSVLSKEVFLITPVGTSIRRETRHWPSLIVPLVFVGAWATFLTVTMGEGFTGRGNLSWPFQGILQAASAWSGDDAADLFYLVFALGSVALGLAHGLARASWLRWPIIGWSVLASISSDWVWDLGNNAARAFAPIVILVALAWSVDSVGQLPTSSRRNLPVYDSPT